MPEKEFADELKAWRYARGWTQEDAAKYLDVPLKTYQNWEWGRRLPNTPGPIRKLMKLAPKPRS